MLNNQLTLESLTQMSKGTMTELLGIEFIEIGDDFVKASMPVDSRTHQPFGILHGGASVAMAETLGSIGALGMIDSDTHYCVGLDINSNHIKSVRSGMVYGISRPIHIGKNTHVWEIRITDEEGNLINISRLTMAIIKKKKN